MIRVIEVLSQQEFNITLREWGEYWDMSGDQRRERGILNALSLETSGTKLGEMIESPSVVRQLDWVDIVWPPRFKRGFTATALKEEKDRFRAANRAKSAASKGGNGGAGAKAPPPAATTSANERAGVKKRSLTARQRKKAENDEATLAASAATAADGSVAGMDAGMIVGGSRVADGGTEAASVTVSTSGSPLETNLLRTAGGVLPSSPPDTGLGMEGSEVISSSGIVGPVASEVPAILGVLGIQVDKQSTGSLAVSMAAGVDTLARAGVGAAEAEAENEGAAAEGAAAEGAVVGEMFASQVTASADAFDKTATVVAVAPLSLSSSASLSSSPVSSLILSSHPGSATSSTVPPPVESSTLRRAKKSRLVKQEDQVQHGGNESASPYPKVQK